MNLNELSKEQLIDLIKQLKRRKKFGLVWEDKPEDVFERCKKELPVLDEVKKKEIISDENLPTNLIIEGDNYHALSVLNYTHQQKIDLIYIDPPYNTGNNDFKYNDNFVSSEDSYRNSKWVSFMFKRLQLVKALMKDSGVILISIDDNEYAHLKIIMDELFGTQNFIANMVWQSKTGSSDARTIDTVTEYILVYAKDAKKVVFKRNLNSYDVKRYRLKDEYYEDRGPYYKDNLDRGGLRYSDSLNFPIECPDGSFTYPNGRSQFVNDGWTWKWGKKQVEWGIKNGFIVFCKSKLKKNGWAIYYKNYLNVNNKNEKVQRSIAYKNLITEYKTGDGASVIKDMFGHHVFKYSKPVNFIQFLLNIMSPSKDEDFYILDFFAGSGTTGHAVIKLNKEDGANRRFILCTNNEQGIAEEVCYPRIKKVIDGYSNIDGISANVRYFKTAFVSKSKISDDTRTDLVHKSAEMICVRENTFNKLEETDEYKIYEGNNIVTGILFNLQELEKFKKAISIQGREAHIYVFSLSTDTYDKDFKDLEVKYSLCPIPESILEVYRKLFKE